VAGDGRVAVVVRPVDRALAVLRLALIPLLAVLVALPTIQALTKSASGVSAQWLVLAVAPAVTVAYVALLHTQPIGGRVDRIFAAARRHVAVACNHDAPVEHGDGRIACWLTPEVLRTPVIPYTELTKAIAALTDACGTDEPGQYWFVEGESGRGKTRTALYFVQSLVRDRRFFELGNRCYLYDFADSEAVQNEFPRALRTPRYDGAVILVDNFQLVRPDVLRALTDKLIGSPGTVAPRLLIFLARPAEAWNLSLGGDVRLLSEAKAAHHYLELAGPQSDTVARFVADIDQAAGPLIRDLSDGARASAAQLYFAQVIARNRTVPPEVAAALRLIGPHPEAVTPPAGLVAALAVVTALAMHRGTFSRRELDRALQVADPGADLSLRAAVRRLHAVGLIAKIEYDAPRYIFHEAIAELCIDRLSGLESFRAAFVSVGRKRLQDLPAEEDALQAWLVAVEVGALDMVEANFDAALSEGAYKRMARCLKRASSRYELSLPARLQLGILLNRSGQWIEARATFTEDLVQALRSSEELGAMLATSWLEATHDPAAEEAIGVLARQPSRFVAIVGEYWQLHMDGHRGRFHSERLLELAIEARSMLDERESYWRVYSLARIHFDSLRHHYLEGGTPAAAVASRVRRDIQDYLRPRLATAEALHILYARAHLVGHTLLPQLAVFKEPIADSDAALADITSETARSVDALAAETQRLYKWASEEFRMYGDREYFYLKADVANALMIQPNPDFEEALGLLGAYEDWVERSDFRHINSYPHFYFLRWNVLMHYEVLMRGGPNSTSDAALYLRDARRRLERVAELDEKARNEYGVIRAQVLSALLRGADEGLDASELAALEAQTSARGYGFETRLLRHLIERGAPVHTELRAIFRFYPFVSQ
jgi:hypothetical protein